MDEIVVAKPDRTQIAVAIVAALIVFVPAIPFGSRLAPIVLPAVALAALHRFTKMKLSVTPSSVLVVNYATRHELPLETVRILDERDNPVLLSDGGGKFDRSGRALYLTDGYGQKVRVGMAPVYGNRLDDIAEDLYRAIDTMRAAG